MIDADLKFVIPTYHVRDVSETVDAYDENLEIWLTLLEIVYFQKKCRSLPIRRVKNKDRVNGRQAA